jgi:hypothetical protein
MRGRPKKERFTHPAGLSDPLTAQQTDALKAAMLKVPEVARLPPVDMVRLAELIAEALAHYAEGADLSRQTPTKRGGPHRKPHRTHLLCDCARAWKQVTGDDVKLWVTQQGRASLAVRLAHATLPVADPHPLSLSAWRSLCDGARKCLELL